MVFVLLLYVAFILHVSLFPWQFQQTSFIDALWSSLHYRPAFSRRVALDFAANIGLYAPLGVFAYLAVRRYAGRVTAAAAAFVLGAAVSAGVETLQLFTADRYSNVWDLLANVCGALSGAVAGAFLELRRRARPKEHGWGASGAAILLFCWAGYQLYPLMFETLRKPLLAKLQRLGGFDAFHLLASAADWIAVDILARSAAGRHARPAFFALMLLLPARFLIRGRAVSWMELAALPAAAAARAMLSPAGRKSAGIAAALLAAAILSNGLRPLPAAPPGQFEWAPFKSIFAANFEQGPAVLLLKSFRYGGLIWLLRLGGAHFGTAAAAVAGLLTCIEAAQLYIPGHVAETTDPVLALGLASVLFAFERLGVFSSRNGTAATRGV